MKNCGIILTSRNITEWYDKTFCSLEGNWKRFIPVKLIIKGTSDLNRAPVTLNENFVEEVWFVEITQDLQHENKIAVFLLKNLANVWWYVSVCIHLAS